jgi:hypothetical protein
MNVSTDVKITDIALKISAVMSNTISNIENTDLRTTELSHDEVLVSGHIGTNSNDTFSISYSFALKSNPENIRVLNVFIIQNINNGDFCVIISSGENDGMKVLFKSINKFPTIGIEKYLPNIIKSTISFLK